MDAVKFLEERARMCGHGCKNCPAYGEQCDIYKEGCDYESLVEAVEKWAAEHPRKTRQSVFLEQWSTAKIDESGCLNVCPYLVSATHRNEDGGCAIMQRNCYDCRHEFWMQEVE